MLFDFFIFGVPSTFQIYPNEQPKEYEFYIQFYDGSKIDWKLVVQRSQKYVRYTYLHYNLLSGTNRNGSFIGFSLKFDNVFCLDTIKLLELFKAVYKQQLKEQFVIKYNEAKKPSFAIIDLLIEKNKFDLIKEVFSLNLEEHFNNEFSNIDASFDTIDIASICIVTETSSNSQLIEKLKQFNTVEIIPQSEADTITSQKEEFKRLDGQYLSSLNKLSSKIPVYVKYLQEKWSNLQTQLNTFTLLNKNVQAQKKDSIIRGYKELASELEVHLSVIFEKDLSLLNQLSQKFPDHSYLNEILVVYKTTIDEEQERLERLSKAAKDLKDVLHSIEMPGNGKIIEKIVFEKRKLSSKAVMLGAIVVAILLALYFTFPSGKVANSDNTLQETSTSVNHQIVDSVPKMQTLSDTNLTKESTDLNKKTISNKTTSKKTTTNSRRMREASPAHKNNAPTKKVKHEKRDKVPRINFR